MLDFVLAGLVLWLVVAPLLTLVHELGHALPVLRGTRQIVTVHLGPLPGARVWTVGRVRFGLNLLGLLVGWGGLCVAEQPRALTHALRVRFVLGGPLASLGLFALGLAGSLAVRDAPPFVAALTQWSTLAALVQFVFTIVPMTYPRWLGLFGWARSDGAHLRELLSGRVL